MALRPLTFREVDRNGTADELTPNTQAAGELRLRAGQMSGAAAGCRELVSPAVCGAAGEPLTTLGR